MTEQYMKMMENATQMCKSNVAVIEQEDEFSFLIFKVIESWAEAHRMDPTLVAEDVLQLTKLSCSFDKK